MLRLLRKIKPGKPAGENSGSFWRFAIAESVLIFLGILIALQVDNWNQDRKDRKLEQVLLSEMLSDLHSDLQNIERNTHYLTIFHSASQVVLDFLKSDLPWHDSLGLHFSDILGAALFDYNASAYESLKSIGIDLIRTDSLRQQITKVYTSNYSHVKANEKLLFDFLYDNLYPANREKLQTVILMEKVVPVNLEELRQDNAFLEDLNMSIWLYRLSLRANRIATEGINKLIADIEQELGLEPVESN